VQQQQKGWRKVEALIHASLGTWKCQHEAQAAPGQAVVLGPTLGLQMIAGVMEVLQKAARREGWSKWRVGRPREVCQGVVRWWQWRWCLCPLSADRSSQRRLWVALMTARCQTSMSCCPQDWMWVPSEGESLRGHPNPSCYSLQQLWHECLADAPC